MNNEKAINLNIRVPESTLNNFNSLCEKYGLKRENAIISLMEKALTEDILEMPSVPKIGKESLFAVISQTLKEFNIELTSTSHERLKLFYFEKDGQSSALLSSSRKMGLESPVFKIDGKSVIKLMDFAKQHNAIPYIAAICETFPLPGKETPDIVWCFFNLNDIPKAEPKNRDYSIYMSNKDNGIFVRIRDKKDFDEITKLTEKSLDPIGLFKNLTTNLHSTFKQKEDNTPNTIIP